MVAQGLAEAEPLAWTPTVALPASENHVVDVKAKVSFSGPWHHRGTKHLYSSAPFAGFEDNQITFLAS